MASNAVLQVDQLTTHVTVGNDGASHKRSFAVVNKVTFDLYPGEILGVVGESGCGKSMMCFSLVNLLERPTHLSGGAVIYKGDNLTTMTASELRNIRGKGIAMVFQDPMVSLNPVLTIGEQMMESIYAHSDLGHDAARNKVIDTLRMVGIPSPESRMTTYPHQLSGGMRQRVVIAAAFLNNPDIIIADEPTTALDVTIQAQIIAEIQMMAANNSTAVIWVSHDLSLLSGLADRIMVMYAGQVVELGTTTEVLVEPKHHYTQALLRAIPKADSTRLHSLDGFPPNLSEPLAGCAFAPRCKRAEYRCTTEVPEPITVNNHTVRCHFPVSNETSS